MDIAILAVTGYGFVAGLRAGVIREVAGVAALVCGIAAAKLFGPAAVLRLRGLGAPDAMWVTPAAWIGIMVATGLAARFVGLLLTKTAELAALGPINKLLGGIFGGLKYILLFSIVFNMLGLLENHLEIPGAGLRKESELYGPVSRVAPALFSLFKNSGIPNNLFG